MFKLEFVCTRWNLFTLVRFSKTSNNTFLKITLVRILNTKLDHLKSHDYPYTQFNTYKCTAETDELEELIGNLVSYASLFRVYKVFQLHKIDSL